MSSSITHRLVCLANSLKPDGRCVAAKVIVDGQPGPWVRPVSVRTGGELSVAERRYANYREPQVGDVFTAALVGPHPHTYQAENFLVDTQKKWILEGALTFDQLVPFADECSGELWIDDMSSSYGRNDQVPLAVAPQLGSSLKFLRIPKFTVRIQSEEHNGKAARKIRGVFVLNGTTYVLSITDPKIRHQYEAHAEGDHGLEDVLVCVSLGEPWHGYAYKLVASVIVKGL